MTDLDRLRSRLARLAEAPVVGAGGWRVLTGQNGPTPASAMQREIEETQFPRLLAFLNDRDEPLGLLARAGRILSVVDLPAQSPEHSLQGKPLSDSDPADSAGVASCLARFLAQTQTIRVRSSLRPPVIDGAAMGLTTAACFAAVASPAPDLPPPDLPAPDLPAPDLTQSDLTQSDPPPGRPDDLASHLASLDAAWIRIDGSEVVAHHGDGPRIARLLDFAEAELTAGPFASPTLENPDPADRCILYCAEADSAEAVLAGQLNGQTVFMAFKAADMPAVLAIWTGAHRQPQG